MHKENFLVDKFQGSDNNNDIVICSVCAKCRVFGTSSRIDFVIAAISLRQTQLDLQCKSLQHKCISILKFIGFSAHSDN